MYARYVDTGDVVPKMQPAHPDSRKTVYLHEICAKIVEATGITIRFKLCARFYGLQSRSTGHRGAFMANILQYPHNFLVWVDETSCVGLVML